MTTSTNTFYVGDVGTELIVDVGSDISTSTVRKLYVRKPSGEEVIWTASIGNPDAYGKYTRITYTIRTGDWDEAGWWSLQSYIEMPGWKGRGTTSKFELKADYK